MKDFFMTFLTMLLVALIPLVLYAIRKCGKEFDFISWILINRTRFILGFVLMMLLSSLLHFVPESTDILTLIGFNVGKSSAAVGFAIGSLLVLAINGNKTE